MITGNKFFSLNIPSNGTAISTGNKVLDSFAFGQGVHVLGHALIL
jgi:hypothetical protein